MSGDTDTLGPVDAAPREGCAAWCTDHVDHIDGYAYQVNICSTSRHIKLTDYKNVVVSLRRSQGFEPVIYVDLKRVELDNNATGDVYRMTTLMRLLGHEDVAAAIDELAALT